MMILRVGKKERDSWKLIPPRYWTGLILAAILGYYLSSLLDFWGLSFIDASIERLILFMYPTFIAIIASFWFKEKITTSTALALAISYAGLLFVFGQQIGSISLSTSFWQGSLLILLCAMTFAIYMIMSQWLIPHFGAISFTSFCMTLACIFVILHYGIVNDPDMLFSFERPVYFLALGMALLATVLPSYLVSLAIERIGATKAAIISSVGPISTISLAYIFLDERLSLVQILGGLFIIAGVTYISVEQRKKKALKTG
jgi:drug/metabolite transporter (DMT)-like permease